MKAKFEILLKKIIMLLTIMLITTISVSAQEETTYTCPDGFVVGINNNCISTSITPTVKPDSQLYNLKLWLEDLQETLTLNDAKKLILKQEHLQNRLNELRYEMSKGNNKNIELLMQKIQIKQLEIEENLNEIPKCVNGRNPGGCYFDYILSSDKGLLNKDGELIVIKHSQEVLTSLLNDTRMPEQSRRGLENAVNRTIKSVNIIKVSIKNNSGKPEIVNVTAPNVISANMVQGTYSVNPNYLSILPFTNVAVLDPSENKWYSIVIENDKIIILDYLNRDKPQYYLYPTSSQIKSFELTARKINKNGITTKDKIQLLKLWYEIKKEEVR